MSKKQEQEAPAFLTSKSKTIKGMTGREQVSLVVTLIQGSKVASRWDAVNDYPKVSEVKQLVAKSEGVLEFAAKVMDRYCPGTEVRQQLDGLFNEWVKRNTAEVRARVESLCGTDSVASLEEGLTLQEWAGEPHDQMASLLDFHPQFKVEFGAKARQHLISIGAMRQG